MGNIDKRPAVGASELGLTQREFAKLYDSVENGGLGLAVMIQKKASRKSQKSLSIKVEKSISKSSVKSVETKYAKHLVKVPKGAAKKLKKELESVNDLIRYGDLSRIKQVVEKSSISDVGKRVLRGLLYENGIIPKKRKSKRTSSHRVKLPGRIKVEKYESDPKKAKLEDFLRIGEINYLNFSAFRKFYAPKLEQQGFKENNSPVFQDLSWRHQQYPLEVQVGIGVESGSVTFGFNVEKNFYQTNKRKTEEIVHKMAKLFGISPSVKITESDKLMDFYPGEKDPRAVLKIPKTLGRHLYQPSDGFGIDGAPIPSW